jgi:SnoaL-like domain
MNFAAYAMVKTSFLLAADSERAQNGVEPQSCVVTPVCSWRINISADILGLIFAILEEYAFERFRKTRSIASVWIAGKEVKATKPQTGNAKKRRLIVPEERVVVTQGLSDRDLLTNVYSAFNARDVDAVLAVMSADVDWPNGWEGGRVYGHQGVRDYWTRQWAAIVPHVEPIGFDTDEMGRTVVKVHQVVRDLEGNVIADGVVEHIYLIENGLIKSMEIRQP